MRIRNIAVVSLGIALTAGLTYANASYQEERPVEPEVISSSCGRGDGALGDTMKTSFMEFTVNDAAVTSYYQGITPDAGMELLVLNITTHVTQRNDLILYDTDYQIQWGSDGPLDYGEPLTYRDEWADFTGYKQYINLTDVYGMFPGVVTLPGDTQITYDYVYQIPEGNRSFKLLFQEFFEDESLGDFFTVSFIARDVERVEGTLGSIEEAAEVEEPVQE